MRNHHCQNLSSTKQRLAGLALACLTLCSSTGLQVQAQPIKPTTAPQLSYVLRIRHKDMGLMSAHVSKLGLLIDTSLASLVTAPPAYDTIIFNPERKNYISIPSAAMDKKVKLMVKQNEFENRSQGLYAKREMGPWQIKEKDTLLGLNMVVYRRVTKQVKNKQTYTTMLEDVWLCRDPRLMNHSAEFRRIISFLWQTPEMDFGIPLKRVLTMAITDKKGNILRQDKPTIEYTLLSCKEEKTDPSRFKLPPGYTKSADELEVIGLSSLGGQSLFSR